MPPLVPSIHFMVGRKGDGFPFLIPPERREAMRRSRIGWDSCGLLVRISGKGSLFLGRFGWRRLAPLVGIPELDTDVGSRGGQSAAIELTSVVRFVGADRIDHHAILIPAITKRLPVVGIDIDS